MLAEVLELDGIAGQRVVHGEDKGASVRIRTVHPAKDGAIGQRGLLDGIGRRQRPQQGVREAEAQDGECLVEPLAEGRSG